MFKQAFDKITEAYIKDRIRPLSGNYCICGTLYGNSNWMNVVKLRAGFPYSIEELIMIESALLSPLIPFGAEKHGDWRGAWGGWLECDAEGYEDALFDGMSAALDIFREIHISRGEDVEAFEFKKREVVSTEFS